MSTLFSPEDRGVAVEVVRDHGGQWAGLAACIGWCESPGGERRGSPLVLCAGELVAAPAGDYHISPLDVGGAKAGPEEGRHTTMIWLVIILLSHVLDSCRCNSDWLMSLSLLPSKEA